MHITHNNLNFSFIRKTGTSPRPVNHPHDNNDNNDRIRD